METGGVIVTNTITHNNFGDLIGILNHNSRNTVLNNHRSVGIPPGPYEFIYDDTTYPVAGSQPSDGPGSLGSFIGREGIGPWILTEVDNSLTQTGSVAGLTLLVLPHKDLKDGLNISLGAGQWARPFPYIEVPAAATNLTIYLTNLTTPPLPINMYIRYQEPDFTNYDKMIVVSNGVPFWNGSISIGQSDVPPLRPGRYYIGIYNPNNLGTPDQQLYLIATLGLAADAPSVDFGSGGATPLKDDAVTYSSITVTNPGTIYSLNVGLRVDHPRISDLVFHLISPDGTRYLLMENRGGTSTNGAGGIATVITNTVWQNGFEGGIGSSYTSMAGDHLAGWFIDFGSVDWFLNGFGGFAPYQGDYFIDLDGSDSGGISTNISTVSGGVLHAWFCLYERSWTRLHPGAASPSLD